MYIYIYMIERFTVFSLDYGLNDDDDDDDADDADDDDYQDYNY